MIVNNNGINTLVLSRDSSSLTKQAFLKPTKTVIKVHICADSHRIFQPHHLESVRHQSELGRQTQLDGSPPGNMNWEKEEKVGGSLRWHRALKKIPSTAEDAEDRALHIGKMPRVSTVTLDVGATWY